MKRSLEVGLQIPSESKTEDMAGHFHCFELTVGVGSRSHVCLERESGKRGSRNRVR